MGIIMDAANLAYSAHCNQRDKGGEPYMRHVRQVARYTEAMLGDESAIAAAWLHDLVEDTPITLDELRSRGFPEEVVAAVDALTRRPDESNRAYVLRVAQNPRAVPVKRADYLDNMDPRRMAKLEPDVALRLLRVMADSQYILGKALILGVPGIGDGEHIDS